MNQYEPNNTNLGSYRPFIIYHTLKLLNQDWDSGGYVDIVLGLDIFAL